MIMVMMIDGRVGSAAALLLSQRLVSLFVGEEACVALSLEYARRNLRRRNRN